MTYGHMQPILEDLQYDISYVLRYYNVVHQTWRRGLFPFRKRSLPFLTVDAIIGNQAFCHGRCNICSGLSHNKVTNTFLNNLRKNKV